MRDRVCTGGEGGEGVAKWVVGGRPGCLFHGIDYFNYPKSCTFREQHLLNKIQQLLLLFSPFR